MSINDNIDIKTDIHYTKSELAERELSNSCVAVTVPNMKPWYMECIDDLHNEGVISDEELIAVYADASEL